MGLHLLFSHSVLSDSFATPRTVACQAPLSMRFPRQEYWSGLPFSSPGNLPNQGSNSHLLRWQADSLPLSYQRSLSLTLDKALRIPRLNLSINSVPVRIWGGFIQALSTVPGTQSGLSKLCTCWWVSATLLQDCEETGADPPHLWGNISDSSATVQLWGLESLKSSSSSESRMDPFLSLSVFSSS